MTYGCIGCPWDTLGLDLLDERGEQQPLSYFGDGFYHLLFTVKDLKPELFEPNIDILNNNGLPRSCQWGATSCMTNVGICGTDIDWVNRWNMGGEEIISSLMQVIYVKQKQLFDTYL